MFHRLFHPTDFSDASGVAFVHALKIALAAHGSLTILHVVAEGEEGPQSSFPHVRRTLASWGLVARDCLPQEVAGLGILIKKLEIEGNDATAAISGYLGGRQMDLVVLATHQRGGLSEFRHQRVAEPVMRATQIPSLFIPPACEGFVGVEEGAVTLRRVVVPVAPHPDAQAAVDAAHALGQLFGPSQVELTLLHVGRQGGAPRLRIPEVPGWTWTRVSEDGPVVETILDAASQAKADLLVMTTHGPQGFLGALRGSTGSTLVRRSPCAVLAIPAR